MVFHNTSQGEGSTPQFFLSIADKLKWEVEKYTDKSTSGTFNELGGFSCSYLARIIIKSNQMLVFEERGKPEFPEKNLSEQSREPTNSAHI